MGWEGKSMKWLHIIKSKKKKQKIYKSMIQFLLKWNTCVMCVHEHAHVYAYVSVLTLIPVKILAMFISVGDLEMWQTKAIKD